ncbi:phage integrase [Yersinia frederiksenii]|nr:phage integrase [Yersinia frederiksenii]
MKRRLLQIRYINQKFGKMQIEAITTKHIADFINTYAAVGKSLMVVNSRSVLSDVSHLYYDLMALISLLLKS